MLEKDAELLEKFERLASFSEKRRKEPLPPFVLWALTLLPGLSKAEEPLSILRITISG